MGCRRRAERVTREERREGKGRGGEEARRGENDVEKAKEIKGEDVTSEEEWRGRSGGKRRGEAGRSEAR